MYRLAENYEYQSILQEMLAAVPNDIDKREGSVIYNTLSPVALELGMQTYMLGYLFNLLFADTAEGEWLDRVVADFGVTRDAATQAIRKICTYDSEENSLEVPVGSRFAVEDIYLTLTEKIDTGQYKAQCEQFGTVGNQYSGTILPVDNINGLGRAELIAEPLIPARDEETDTDLRIRFYQTVRQSPYGGNIADYERETLNIDGVGAVKVFNATVMGAGKVGLVIGDEQEHAATEELIDKVQEKMGTDGNGIAPIGHTVTVKTGTSLAVNVSAQIKLKTGSSFDLVKPIVEQAITDYIEGIGFADQTVFYAKLVAEILNSHESILDVGTVTINNQGKNLTLSKTYTSFQLPTVGTITVSEVS